MRTRRPWPFQRHAWPTLLARIALSLACGGQLVACDTRADPRATAYVILKPTQEQTFLDDLDSLSRVHGLTPKTGSATPDRGVTLHVLEARGALLRLWAQNVPLSPGECGDSNSEATVDPGQFIVMVLPRMGLPVRDSARDLSTALTSELRAKGYLVLSDSVQPCSKAYLSEVQPK
jgi:hypothetical protein